MHCVTYNIQYSRGKDGQYDLARCIGEIRGADIIALQEVERHWERSDMADQPAEIAALLPGYHWVFGPSFDVALANPGRPPGHPVDNRRRQFGDMLLSRWPILSSRTILLPKTRYPDRFNMTMGAIEGVVDCPLAPLRVWSIHIGYLAAEERLAHLRELWRWQTLGATEGGAWSGPGAIGGDDWTGGAPPPPMPAATLWLGDFNMTPDSAEYDLVTGVPPAGYGFVDAWARAGGDAGPAVTCPESVFEGLRAPRRIDYAFVSPDLAPRIETSRIDRAAVGSDHQPVWLSLTD